MPCRCVFGRCCSIEKPAAQTYAATAPLPRAGECRGWLLLSGSQIGDRAPKILLDLTQPIRRAA